MEQIAIFEEEFLNIINDGIHNVHLESPETDGRYFFLFFCFNMNSIVLLADDSPVQEEWILRNPTNLTCSYCRIQFSDSVQQREHYKLDWHRYNLKQDLISREPLTEEQFNQKAGNIFKFIIEIACFTCFSYFRRYIKHIGF